MRRSFNKESDFYSKFSTWKQIFKQINWDEFFLALEDC